MNYKFCPVCGGNLHEKYLKHEAKHRLVCMQCNEIFYINPAPTTAVILLNGKNILLIKRKYEPKQGYWSLPAGFVEYDETLEQGAIREIKEETNLNVQLTDIVGVFTSHENPEKHVILTVFKGEILGGNLKAGDDTEVVKYFPVNELPDAIAWACHREAIARITLTELTSEHS